MTPSLDDDVLELVTHGPEATEALGRALAELLPSGSVIALRGELASGKTCLVRGMAERFASGGEVHSPTFTLVNEYGSGPRLYHVDLYRLAGPDEAADLGHAELFEPDGITVVEWAERAEPLLPEKRLDVWLEHVGPTERRLMFCDRGILPCGWAQRLKKALGRIERGE